MSISCCNVVFIKYLRLRDWQNFEELIQLAEQGDRRKVDILCGDMKRRDRTDVDWYSLMPEQTTTFTLGKAADERYDGKSNNMATHT